MKYIKVIFDNGDYLETRINGDKETIKNHYIGNKFQMTYGTVIAVKVEFL
jgi:hypothetical protein